MSINMSINSEILPGIISLMKFHHVVCGGTFDHLHFGHKKLLETCLSLGERVTVGITNGALSRHKAYNFSLQSYAIRAKNVAQFNTSLTLYKLRDIYGPTLTDATIDAICVTKDTYSGAKSINKKRKQLGIAALPIITVPFVLDEMGDKISSEHIRQGVADRYGNRYDAYLFSKEVHTLPESLKARLRKPLGRVVPAISALSEKKLRLLRAKIAHQGYFYLCAVGDMVTMELKKQDIGPFISLIDGFTQRKALTQSVIETIFDKDYYNAPNEKGTIQKSACIALQKLFAAGQNKAIKQLLISGEEDLLTLAAVLFAPLGASVWHGQKGVGAVEIEITEKIKETVYNLVRQFK